MIKAGIVGGAGYTAGELIRLLLNHPQVTLDFIFSTSNAGNEIQKVHSDLLGDTDIRFDNKVKSDVDNMERLRRLTTYSPVFNTITQGANVDIRVEAR